MDSVRVLVAADTKTTLSMDTPKNKRESDNEIKRRKEETPRIIKNNERRW